MTLPDWISGLQPESPLPPPELRTEETVDALLAEAMAVVRQDYARSKILATMAMTISRALRSRGGLGKSSRMMGHIALLSGKSRQAVRQYEKAWKYFADDEIERANTSVAMVQGLAYIGDYNRAFEVAEQSIRVFEEAGDHFRASRLKANVGNILHRLDRLEEAEARYREALPILTEHQAQADLAIVMRNYGVVLMGMRKFEEADAMYSAAREVFAEADQSLLLFEIDLNRAYLMGRRGDVLDALRAYRALLDSLPEDSGFEIGHCLLDQADFLLSSGLWTDAARASEEARRVFRTLDAKFEQGKAALLHAVALIRRGTEQEAREKFAEASRFLRREPNQNWRAMLYQAKAELDRRQGKIARARQQMALALECQPSVERRPAILRDLITLALDAQDFTTAQDLLSQMDAPDIVARLARSLGDQAAAAALARTAIVAFDEERALLGSVGLRRGAAAARREMLAECLACFTEPADRWSVVARMKDQTLAEVVQLPAELAAAGRIWESTRRDQSLSSEEDRVTGVRERERLTSHTHVLAANLPSPSTGTRLVEFYSHESEIRAILVESGRVEEHVLGELAEVQEIARFFHFNRLRRTDGGARLTHRALERFASLLAPVLHDAPARLIFGRDVSFATLPIHAIPLAGETLLDQHDVFYVPSLSVWGALTQRERCGGSGTALIGAADELAPHIQTELETVSRLRETPILTTREEFESRAAEAKYLHIAAHGILREDQPMFNAMKIGDDGWTVFDVLHLSLRAELCVLSGCSTGVSLLDDTFAAQGFIEALLAAGCQGVLASGWDTADEPNAAFMATFYEVLPSRTILEAYREASRQTREVWPNPGDWAPFALYGAFS